MTTITQPRAVLQAAPVHPNAVLGFGVSEYPNGERRATGSLAFEVDGALTDERVYVSVWLPLDFNPNNPDPREYQALIQTEVDRLNAVFTAHLQTLADVAMDEDDKILAAIEVTRHAAEAKLTPQ